MASFTRLHSSRGIKKMVRYLFLVLLMATYTYLNVALPSDSVKGRMWWAAMEEGRAEKRSATQI